jgi:hypothetical protein
VKYVVHESSARLWAAREHRDRKDAFPFCALRSLRQMESVLPPFTGCPLYFGQVYWNGTFEGKPKTLEAGGGGREDMVEQGNCHAIKQPCFASGQQCFGFLSCLAGC